MAHRIRVVCGAALFQVPTFDLTDHDTRSSSAAFADLLGYDAETNTYSQLPPIILLPDNNGETTRINRMFLNPILFSVRYFTPFYIQR